MGRRRNNERRARRTNFFTCSIASDDAKQSITR
jgi:hypothetical protein